MIHSPMMLLSSMMMSMVSGAPTNAGTTISLDAHAASVTTTAAATCSTTPAPPNQTLIQSLVAASSANERQSLLTDADFVFDFKNPCTNGQTFGKGGHTVRADRASFPALVSHGASVTVGFLGPCGFNTPHTHPRAAELNLVVEGRLFGSVTAENGARHMNHTLETWQMTVFPQGALHTEFNPDCEPATFVASFPNEDPGVGQAAQLYFGLEDEIVKQSVGGDLSIAGADIDTFRHAIPPNVALGVDACLKKCGIAKR